MYSSRRRYYRKNFRRNLFSPSYRTGIPPTYTQMKGRVIRTTPTYSPNAIPPVMSKELLDQMKKILIDAHYFPIIQDYSKYTTMGIAQLLLSNVTSDGYIIDGALLPTIAASVFTLPAPPTGTHWTYSIMGFAFNRSNQSSTDDTRLTVEWDSSLLQSSPAILIKKEVDLAGYNGPYTSSIIIKAGNQANQAYANIVTIQNYNIVPQLTLIPTTDAHPDDNETYPLVTTDSNIETYGSSLLFTNTVVSQYVSLYSYDIYILCYISLD